MASAAMARWREPPIPRLSGASAERRPRPLEAPGARCAGIEEVGQRKGDPLDRRQMALDGGGEWSALWMATASD